MDNNVLEITGLNVEYKVKRKIRQILSDISMTAKASEIIAIMGPSGCGKSILLKNIAGILNPTGGRRVILGRDCTREVPIEIKEQIGFIYQDSNLLPWRSVYDNLKLPFEIFGKSKYDKIDTRISEALEMVGLADYKQALPQELSGGMMQRVGIARAMVFKPQILLMDQPFGALDAITRRKLRFDFLRIFEQAGPTIVIVTNSIDEALLFASKVIVLGGMPGQIEEIIDVPFPYAERTTEVAFDEKYTDLRKHMIDIISRQYREEKGHKHEPVS